ncbi:hypothetical protein HWB90_gp074 [Mycobacterium phage Fowlmouth]|uniref:Uncharacterized protein n=1 Tax=Mycobacterium phage Fowlmouth TaxID=2419978 RepID=A0A3G2KGH5_9CAUD|nr:hypothetical protein HWB90_gp074 [Mycobacterium phage Fowlmouth]AYN58065.1 hypothetical protein SEA_FOWLMOUTH_116 [Mycobacterium phage Fowlmouth]
MNISYHWSPSSNHDSIIRRGLLVPKAHPRLTTPVTCSENHRNPHISLGRTPMHAWSLSGGFLLLRAQQEPLAWNDFQIPLKWDLWEVILPKIRPWRKDDYELTVDQDILPGYLKWVAHRWITESHATH